MHGVSEQRLTFRSGVEAKARVPTRRGSAVPEPVQTGSGRLC